MIELADHILSTLQGDATFLGYLGTFTFTDNSTAPSLAILAANEQLEGIKTIEGVECVIMRTPEMSSRPILTGCTILEKTWRIYLVEYAGGDPNDCVNAADRICAIFPGASYVVTYTNDGSLDIAGQQQVVVKLPPHVVASEAATLVSGGTAEQKEGTLSVDGGSPCD